LPDNTKTTNTAALNSQEHVLSAVRVLINVNNWSGLNWSGLKSGYVFKLFKLQPYSLLTQREFCAENIKNYNGKNAYCSGIYLL